jgi:hypothetical protein
MKFQPDTGKFPRSPRVSRICMMKKFFALYVLAVLAVAAGITSAKAGTITHWTFEEGTPGSTAGTIIDIASGNNGTAIDGPTYVGGAISGYGSKGLNFDGGLDIQCGS